MVTALEAKDIVKSYNHEQVLKGLDLQLQDQETLSILGRSGCGKTTLLKILSGLEIPDRGTVLINGTNIQSLPPQKCRVVYLYQEALLFPHLDVFENIAFGLRLQDLPQQEIERSVDSMIKRLGLKGMNAKMPHQLSGGQKQRVSFGRALITNPRVLLLDEPFGNLDGDTRSSMQQFFQDIAEDFQITAVFVTHNVKEAMLMGDRIATLNEGCLNTYDSVDTFIHADHSLIQQEVDFWSSIQNKLNTDL